MPTERPRNRSGGRDLGYVLMVGMSTGAEEESQTRNWSTKYGG